MIETLAVMQRAIFFPESSVPSEPTISFKCDNEMTNLDNTPSWLFRGIFLDETVAKPRTEISDREGDEIEHKPGGLIACVLENP